MKTKLEQIESNLMACKARRMDSRHRIRTMESIACQDEGDLHEAKDNYINELKAQLADSLASKAWLPMESAPRAGEIVLLLLKTQEGNQMAISGEYIASKDAWFWIA